ncbi:MAG: metallophosphoesterase [Oscillospiraceae bacterium]
MIWITGDTHIPIDIHKLSMVNFPEQKQMTKDDYLIICGDFGGVWDNSAEEAYWLKWLNEKSFTTLFVDGNHENFNMLNAYPVIEYSGGKAHRIMPSIYHLMRGQVFEIDGVRIFTMGGASSHDKDSRIEGVSWWSEELPSDDEYEEAFKNLNKHNWVVDLVVTHCAPDSIQGKIANRHEHDKLTNFLEVIRKDLTFEKWYFGHYHTDRTIDSFNVMYKTLVSYSNKPN